MEDLNKIVCECGHMFFKNIQDIHNQDDDKALVSAKCSHCGKTI